MEEILLNLENWMSELPPRIKNAPLYDLVIPGSHDSFSYSIIFGPLGPDVPHLVNCINLVCPCIVKRVLFNWSQTQKKSVVQQLFHGVRYFDIRVGILNNKFHFLHGLFGDELELSLVKVCDFLISHPGEVVLLHFQHFYGLTPEKHLELVNILIKIFNGILCPKTTDIADVTLSNLSQHNYQVIIFYRCSSEKFGQYIWDDTKIPNPWPNCTDISEMFEFLQQQLERKSPNLFFVTQCVLTPSTKFVIRHLFGSLWQSMAKSCNNATMEWLPTVNSGLHGPNVIMTDFLDQDDWELSKAIIRKNYEKMYP